MNSYGQFQYGWIEGFYGRPWSWEDRKAIVAPLARAGFRSYLYAPKADRSLRRGWREPISNPEFEYLNSLGSHLKKHEVLFGIGLSPFEVHKIPFEEARASLKSRIEVFNRLEIDHLAILFDDMRGDDPDLARIQVDLLHYAAEHSRARRLTMCPSYYSDDPILDKLFGQRPANYLEELGKGLDPSIGIYWTGEKIVSKEYSPSHLARMTETLRRKPTLWDNYPVNDTPSMCQFLHLKPFSGRPPELKNWVAEHAINLMNQPYLSLIPAMSLVGAKNLMGEKLTAQVESDASLFQEKGLDGMSAEQKSELIRIYSCFDHPAARECVDWLSGKYFITREEVLAQ